MQVRELVDVGRFFKDFIRDHQLPQKYQLLIDAVNQAAQNQNPENVPTHFDALLQIHEEAEKKVLSPAQSKLIDEYGATELLGRPAAARLERIFSEHRAHPQGMVSALQELLSETNRLAKRASQLIDVLDPMLVDLAPDESTEEEGRLWLYFADAASVNTIEDLEKAAGTWKQVLHHFSRMPGADGVAGRILQIHKYSPLELELAANIAVLVPLAFGIQWVLSRIEHVIRILQEAEKLKQMKIKTKIVKDLQKEAQDHRNKITSEAADEVQKKFKASPEARNAVEQGLKKVVAFIEGGGQLDIDVGSEEPSTDEAAEGEEASDRIELRALIARIRQDIKLLPAGGDEGVDESEESAAKGK